MPAADEILDLALEEGFDLAGLAPLRPPRDGERLRRWLAAGHHAGMDWLVRQAERILDPARVDPRARSLLVVGVGHARDPLALPLATGAGASGPTARLARYAHGRDYHNVLGKRLRRLARRLRVAGLAGPGRVLVDAGPLMERSHAEDAGLGFASKSANLLHPAHGPWFFLGELFLDLELGEDAPAPTPPPGSCGTCTACLDACPTQAFAEPGVLDANRCISYQTIENRGAVPHALRAQLDTWVFGCDVCSEVCPWGRGAPSGETSFGLHEVVERAGRPGGILEWLRWGRAEFDDRVVGTPLRRAGRDGLARNVALVLGNHPGDEGRAALEGALEDPAPGVRAAAFWALHEGHRGDRGVLARLDGALAREPDAAAASDMRATRDA